MRHSLVSVVVFVGVTTLLVSGLHVYLYRRLVRDTWAGPRLRRAGAMMFAGLAAGVPLERLGQGALGPQWGRVCAALVWTWTGVALYLGMILSAAGGLVLLARRARGEPKAQAAVQGGLGRRELLSRSLAGGALVAAGGVAGLGLFRAFEPPEVTELALKLPGLPRRLDGLTLVQLSDVHVGELIQGRFLGELVERANALKPDLVALTGDFVDGPVERLGSTVARLRGLKSRFGSYFVTGNHEYYSGDVEWCEALGRMGITVLRNRRVSVGEGRDAIDLLGVDDLHGGRFGRQGYDLEAALSGRDPGRASILLAHQPQSFEDAVARGIGLQLSGHTHGGQLFPLTAFMPLLFTRYRGYYIHGAGQLYVNRGAGFWGPPMRVGSPPEILRLTLMS